MVRLVGRDYPKTQAEFEERFATEEACRASVAQLRWPEGFVCPRCLAGFWRPEILIVVRHVWLLGEMYDENNVCFDSLRAAYDWRPAPWMPGA